MNYLKKFLGLPWPEKLIFLEAVLFSYAAKLLLWVLPFRYLPKLLAHRNATFAQPDSRQLLSTRKAIYRTRRLAFWQNQCLVMSIASRWMLQRRRVHSSLSLGLAFDENKKLTAHAWLRAGQYYVIDNEDCYQQLYYF